nr:hypothetical protein Itr_chr02CG08670 [Ipomoea trifida]
MDPSPAPANISDSSTGKNCRVTGDEQLSSLGPAATENPKILPAAAFFFLLLPPPPPSSSSSSSSEASSTTTADELEFETDPTRFPFSSSPSTGDEHPSSDSSSPL